MATTSAQLSPNLRVELERRPGTLASEQRWRDVLAAVSVGARPRRRR